MSSVGGLPSRLLRSRMVAGGGGGPCDLKLPVRRDFPELLRPDDGVFGVAPGGALDVLPAGWTQMCSAAQWGAAELLLHGFFTAYSVPSSLPGIGLLIGDRSGRVNVATGAAGAEVLRHEYRYGGQSLGQQTVAGPMTSVAALNAHHPAAPRRYAANTRFAVKAAVFDARASRDVSVCFCCYDPAAWNLVDPIVNWTSWLDGTWPFANTRTDHTDYAFPNAGAGVWVNGAYVDLTMNGGLRADGDYLAYACLHWSPGDDFQGFSQYAAFDIAIGEPGFEVIQSRSWLGCDGLFNGGSVQYIFPLGPFQWLTNERLRVRARDTLGGASYRVTLNVMRYA